MTLLRTLLVAAALAPGPVLAADSGFLFDLLRQKPYHAAWDALMKSVQPTPDWLVQFNKNFDGTSGAVVDASIDGKDYQVSYVCKPADCAAHRFVVAFEPGATPHAFGALGGKDNAPAFFGAPSQALQDAMNKALGRTAPAQ